MKVGVFICHCGHNIAGIIDIQKLLNEIGKDPEIFVIDNEYSCSEPGLQQIKQVIREEGLERIVIGACSPKMHEKLFRDTIEQAGINPYLLEIANIREQDSWVHRTSPDKATIKAIDLVKMAIEKVKYLYPLKKNKIPVKQSVLVLGGGIAGIKASLTLADLGIKVYLVEKEPSIGGHMAMFDKTFPTLDCSICILAPLMVEASLHENIEIMTYSELQEVTGNIGNFKVNILKKARFINENCTSGCIEDCATNCPIEVQDEFNKFGSRKAIYIPFPQAIPLKAIIDKDACIGCRNCEIFCKRDAIDYNDKSSIVELEVGAIINAIGFEPYDPTPLGEYGYSRYPNVITALEMERILTASGPTDGKLIRPSDGKPFKKVVYIQCVGSRDVRIGHEYCSRVCCMYAMKQARLIKENYP
ncbi:MAG: FAD-dependent oxidoreductase, partial [Candidatus Helarchaeota archaeon]